MRKIIPGLILLMICSCSKAPLKVDVAHKKSLEGAPNTNTTPAGPIATGPGSNEVTKGGSSTGNVIAPAAGFTLHPLFRRISGSAYGNSVRDIFGLTLDIASDIPEDALINDFDNAVDQPMGAAHIQSYLSLAKKVADAVIVNKAKLFPCAAAATMADPEACETQVVTGILRRLFRRAATTEEIQVHVALFPKGVNTAAAFNQGLSSMLQLALMSPHFLYLVEMGSGATNAALTNYEYAARLAYVLWNAAPDEILLQKAENDELGKPEEVAVQVKRMLDDPRGKAFLTNFAGQWLGLRFLEKSAPDKKLFPSFTEDLRKAFAAETMGYMDEMRKKNLPLNEMIQSNWTIVNETLANFYGIKGVTGAEFKRVTTNEQRGGVLKQGMIHMITSTPEHTSIVKRGKWVLGKLMCAQLPPPPANIPSFTPVADKGQTLREQFEAHAADPSCAPCHKILDPAGFGLETYDAIGLFRDKDNGKDIDASGVLPGGKAFNGAAELAMALKDDERFTRCAATKLAQYSLGRPPEGEQEKAIFDAYLQGAAKSNFQFQDMIVQFVQSDLFRSVRVIKE